MRFSQFMLIAGSLCACALTPAQAEMTGQQKIQASKSEFRVCADPDNLPFTNRRGEGFENKIAELMARSANQPLSYYWWPQRRGFVNNSLNAWECDVVIGVPTHYAAARTTQPYYCSRYVMIHRAGQSITPSLLDEPRVRSLRIGVVEHTPPLDMLLRRNLDPIVYFSNYDGVSSSPGQIVADVAAEKIDAALVWGPVGGYFARRQAVPLQIEAFKDVADPRARLAFPISFGVRRDDKARSARLAALMRERAAEIQAILRSNGSLPHSRNSSPTLFPPRTWVRLTSKEWPSRRAPRKIPKATTLTARERKPCRISKSSRAVLRRPGLHIRCRTAKWMRRPIRAGYAIPRSAKRATAPAEWEARSLRP